MSKKWTYADFEFAVDSAWSAFENTLRTHGVTDMEIREFVKVSNPKGIYNDVDDALSEAITWEEE